MINSFDLNNCRALHCMSLLAHYSKVFVLFALFSAVEHPQFLIIVQHITCMFTNSIEGNVYCINSVLLLV